MKIKILSIAVLLAVSASAGYCEKMPEWINNSQKIYASDKYMSGVGIGSSLDAARSNARAEIAKIFKAKVEQQSVESAKESTSQDGSKSKTSSSVDSQVSTSVSTDETIEGLEIKETWMDKKKNQYYAMCLLDKVKLNASLAGKLMDLDENIKSLMDSAQNAKTPREELKAICSALDSMNEKEYIFTKKRVVSPVGATDPGAALEKQNLLKRKDKVQGKISFVIDADAALAKAVASKISEMGFAVISDKSTASAAEVYVLKCAVSYSPLERNNPKWKFFSWNGTMEMTENEVSVVSATVTGQTSGLSAAAAEAGAKMASLDEMAMLVKGKISEYMFGK